MRRPVSYTGIIIRRANVGEADRILTVLTDSGKVAVVARGVRRAASKKTGTLEMFNSVSLICAHSSGLPVIREAQLVKAYPHLRTDLRAAHAAYWAAELLDRLLPEESGDFFFDLLERFLEQVNEEPSSLSIRYFEAQFLAQLGWMPELDRCVECQEKLSPDDLTWSHQQGGLIGHECRHGQRTFAVSSNAIKLLRVLSSGAILPRVRVSKDVLDELAHILHGYIEYLAERELRGPGLLHMAFEVNS